MATLSGWREGSGSHESLLVWAALAALVLPSHGPSAAVTTVTLPPGGPSPSHAC